MSRVSTSKEVIREPEQRTPVPTLLVSVESALYIVIVLLAAFLRFTKLGFWPLLTEEAAQAWRAWQLLQGQPQDMLNYSPLLFTGNLFGFFVFGASDAVARLWPSLVGTLLVFLPYFLRDKLGRLGALVASLLLALSPTFLYFSRTLDGGIVVASAALALLVAISGYIETRRPGYVYLGAVALALGLMAGPTIYTFLVALIAFGGYQAFAARKEADSSEEASWRVAWEDLAGDRRLLRQAGGSVIALLLVVGSALLLNIGGWQATLNLFSQWLHQFASKGDGTTWFYYLQILVVYETLPLLAGLAGLLLAFRRGNRLDNDIISPFLGVWFIIALLVHSLAGSRPASATPIILLPLILLAGQAIDRLAQFIRQVGLDPQNWLFVGLSAILVAFLYLQMSSFTVAGDRAYLRLAMAASGVLLLSFAVFWYWIGSAQALPVGGVTILGVLFALFIHSTMLVNYRTPRDPRELFSQAPTSVDIVNVLPFLRDQSGRLEGDQYNMSILVEEGLKPVIAWYTRDFRTVHFARSVPSVPEERAVIVARKSLFPAKETGGPQGFMGQHFRLQDLANTSGLQWGDWLKWYFRRFPVGSLASQDIEVWIRP